MTTVKVIFQGKVPTAHVFVDFDEAIDYAERLIEDDDTQFITIEYGKVAEI